MRMNDADALAEVLGIAENCQDCQYKYGVFCNRSSDFMNACDAIYDAPTIEAEWIPVSERLPEDWIDVLVWFEYFRYGDYKCMYSTYGIGNYSNQYDSWLINHETGWTDLHVFAWMPLPEPPKMEGEKE